MLCRNLLILLLITSWTPSEGLITTSTADWATLEKPAVVGDRLIIRNNAGRVSIRTWDRPTVQVRYRRNLPAGYEGERADEAVKIFFGKAGSFIRFESYFYANDGESVDVEALVPRMLGATITGIEPEIRVEELGGSVRIETLRGSVVARDLVSRVRILSRTGNIEYMLYRQPQASAQVSTSTGTLRCRLGDDLNLALLAQSGGHLLWNQEELEGFLSRDLGKGWPRLRLTTGLGDVLIDSATAGRIREDVPGTVPRHTLVKRPAPRVKMIEDEADLDETTLDSNFKVNVDWVHLNVSVLNRATRQSVVDLKKEDFQVFEDGLRQGIEHFENIEAPYHLLLLLDISGSTKPYLKLIKKASLRFAKQLSPQDRMAVATFNTRTRLLQDFTSDREKVKKAINKIRSGGGTGLYSALVAVLRKLLSDTEGRKAVVLFTDGIDDTLQGNFGSATDITFSDVFAQVGRSDSLVYPIFLNTEDEYRKHFSGVIGGRPRLVFKEARLQLHLIAEQTGGYFFAPLKIKDLGPAYEQVALDLRRHYTLGYKSSQPRGQGKWRRLEVKIKGDPDLSVRHRKGYAIDQP